MNAFAWGSCRATCGGIGRPGTPKNFQREWPRKETLAAGRPGDSMPPKQPGCACSDQAGERRARATLLRDTGIMDGCHGHAWSREYLHGCRVGTRRHAFEPRGWGPGGNDCDGECRDPARQSLHLNYSGEASRSTKFHWTQDEATELNTPGAGGLRAI